MEKILFIEFDRKSLVVPEQDYEIFKKENYYIDDGTTHTFSDEHKCLLITDADNAPIASVLFSEVTLEGKKQYELFCIKKALKKDISPQTNLGQAQKEVASAIQEILILLDGILQKRANPDSISEFKYKYYIRNKENKTYDLMIGLFKRFSYLEFFPQLDYRFGILED